MIEYGTPTHSLDVTPFALKHYFKDDHLCIPSGPKQFNQVFGDPCPHVLKQLKIIHGNSVITIAENDLREYRIPMLDLSQHLNKKIANPTYSHLITHLATIHRAQTAVQTLDSQYYDLTVMNEQNLYDVSIVMTTYNRSRQTYYTLYSLEKSLTKKIQVIIVDDSTTDPLDLFILKHFNLSIYHVKLKNKFWFNPCINYNFGFQFIQGSKIIIQNAEVCHIGDVITYVQETLKDNEYFVFDVNNLKQHEVLYDTEPIYQNIISLKNLTWYQHHQIYNRKLHFLTAITMDTFKLIKGFDYDFCMGSWYDDNEFVFRIEASNIKVIPIPHTIGIMGTHQWHVGSSNDWDRNVIKNEELFHLKCGYFKRHQRFLLSTDYSLEEARLKVCELFEKMS